MNAAKFWSSMDRIGECWLWQLSCNGVGYGQAWYKDDLYPYRRWDCHRLAWYLTHGAIELGLCVCHKCDVRLCCNPSHLFLGTKRDNTQDAKRKGRTMSGERNFNAVLTENQVIQLRAEYDLIMIGRNKRAPTKWVISKAAELSINRTYVSQLIKCGRWRYLI